MQTAHARRSKFSLFFLSFCDPEVFPCRTRVREKKRSQLHKNRFMYTLGTYCTEARMQVLYLKTKPLLALLCAEIYSIFIFRHERQKSKVTISIESEK